MRSAGRFFVLVIFAPMIGVAAEWPARPAAVDAVIREALAGNLALQGEAVGVEQARERLAQARSQLQPRLDLVARYTVAEGGRTIDLPIGDLVNPVYGTLNQLLAAQGQTGGFSYVSNQSIRFLRAHEQETKLRLTQPLYRPEIVHGIQARRAEAESRTAGLAGFRRELRLEVETAWYRLQQVESAWRILQSAAELTAEALRTNRVLFENDKITEDRVLRAEADDLAVRQQIAEAERDRRSALAYLNFLRNRPLDTPAPAGSVDELARAAAAVQQLRPISPAETAGREELIVLERAIAAAEAVEKVQQSRRRPTLGLAVEGGVQGEDYRTGPGYNFVAGSLVAEANVWDGRERRSEVQVARLERRRLELELTNTREQLALQIQRANDDLRAALASLATATRRREASQRAFDLVRQRQGEGLATQLSFLDARQELTNAQLNWVITQDRVLIAAAALDRAAALTPLP